MDFFAIVGGQQQGVYRMNIDQALQDQLSTMFQEQAQSLLDESLEVVPFERENFHPDETEVLQIAPFDLPELIFAPTENAVGWSVLPRDDDLLARVYCVFGYDAENDRIVFQVIPRAQRLNSSGFSLIISNDTFNRLTSPGLVLGTSCHAVYERGSLRFRSMWWTKQILDISSYYRAATEADIERFAAMGNVAVEDIVSLKERSGQWVRTRVAYILDSGVLTNFSIDDLRQKANEFGVNLEAVEDQGISKLVIPQDPKALRSVLKFLEEEYYAGPITGVAYEANSKRRMQE